ncbi:MAG: hypothetical protein J6K43_03150 [Lachnospiraceae bacterium]|nr:hypothetical protein [Lachnospiraceae bacterium]
MTKTNSELCDYSGMASDGKMLWYINSENFLMSINLLNGISTFLGVIPNTSNISYSYRTLLYINNALFLIPYYARTLVKYDLNEKKFVSIPFPEELLNVFGQGYLNLFGGFVSQDEMIMYGMNHFIIKYDFKQCSFSWIDVSKIQNKLKIDVNFWNDGFYIADKNYYPIVGHRVILEEDHISGKIQLIKWGNVVEKNQTITKKYKDKICFVSISDDWNMKIDVIDPIFPEKYETIFDVQLESEAVHHCDEPPFLCGDVVGDKLVLYPGYQNYLWIIDLRTVCVEKNSISNNKYRKAICFNSIKTSKNKTASILQNDEKIVVYDEAEDEITFREIFIDDYSTELLKKEYFDILKNTGIIKEQATIVDVNTFLEWI